jgi:hypothetical protein
MNILLLNSSGIKETQNQAMCDEVMQEELMGGNIGQTMGITKQRLRKKMLSTAISAIDLPVTF